MTLLDDPPRTAPGSPHGGHSGDAPVPLDVAWSRVRSFDPTVASLVELDHMSALLARVRSYTDSLAIAYGLARSAQLEASRPSAEPHAPPPKPKPTPPKPGGLSAAELRRQRDAQTGARLAPSFAEALARGDVSIDHLASLGRVRNPASVAAAEGALLAAAIVRTADEFAQHLRNWDIERDEANGLDVAAQRHQRRGLKFFTGELDMGGTTVVLEPAAQLQVKDAIMRAADQLWRNGDRSSSASQRMADAFHLLITGTVAAPATADTDALSDAESPEAAPASDVPAETASAPAKAKTKTTSPAKPAGRPTMVVFIDEGTLFGRLDAAGYATTVDGVRLTATEARLLAAKADLIPMVLSGKGVVLDVGRRRRNASDMQYLALLAQYGGCILCDAPALWTHDHHSTDWNHGGQTNLHDLWPYCSTHHTMHHANGWRGRIVDGVVHLTDADGIPIETRRRHGPGGLR